VQSELERISTGNLPIGNQSNRIFIAHSNESIYSVLGFQLFICLAINYPCLSHPSRALRAPLVARVREYILNHRIRFQRDSQAFAVQSIS
jgi:hypothetical protein